ncbi:hypothetical protein O0L34_g17977 [Tuta absoluta]|nr:hypothetical protein O0L34_g17977 [Tuta absoluta]
MRLLYKYLFSYFILELPQNPEGLEFKSFTETYKIITFSLSFGLMYPNPATRWLRFIGVSLMIATATPIAIFFLVDIYYCWLRMEVIEIIRHVTILGPFLASFLKQYFMVLFQDSAYAIITEINRDYDLYNKVSEDNKKIVRSSIKNCLVNSERCWMVTVVITVMIFPLMAATSTL